jgi:hypothetical protein
VRSSAVNKKVGDGHELPSAWPDSLQIIAGNSQQLDLQADKPTQVISLIKEAEAKL